MSFLLALPIRSDTTPRLTRIPLTPNQRLWREAPAAQAEMRMGAFVFLSYRLRFALLSYVFVTLMSGYVSFAPRLGKVGYLKI